MKNLSTSSAQCAVDPFLSGDTRTSDGVELRKATIHEVEGIWDLIMYHHSFEPVSDPLEQLQTVSRLLSPAGNWFYRNNWSQLDPPRHFFLHSRESVSIACGIAGLECGRIVDDSDESQFWGSEQVIRGIPLESKQSYLRNRSGSMFHPREIAAFKKRAGELNRLHRGDQAAFYLRVGTRKSVDQAGDSEDRSC